MSFRYPFAACPAPGAMFRHDRGAKRALRESGRFRVDACPPKAACRAAPGDVATLV